MTINWGQVIITILGSSLLSALIIEGSRWRLEGKRTKKEEARELYRNLKLLVGLAKTTDKIKNEVMADYQERGRNNKNIRGEISAERRNLVNPLTEQWWFYIDSIKKLIEAKAGFIQEKDYVVINEFLESYLKREVIGKKLTKDIIWLSDEKEKEYRDGIYRGLDALLEALSET